MQETDSQLPEASLTPNPLTTNVGALQALGRAFNQVGDKRGIESFKAAGRGLMVEARKASMQAPQVGDARRIKTSQGKMPQPRKA